MADSVTKVSPPKSDLMKDIYLWRKKKLAFSILIGSTATWILLNFYGFNYLTLVSWTAIAIVSMFFLWGKLIRLLSKEEPNLARLEVSEDFVTQTVKFSQKSIEETVRWMFRIGAEREWLVFVRTIVGLWILSRIGNFVDIQTCVFIGLVMGLTVPKILENNGDRIEKLSGNVKQRSKEVYGLCYEKIVMMKNRLQHGVDKKVKKTE